MSTLNPARALEAADLLHAAENMGALPVTVTQLAGLVADDSYDMGDVVGIVSLDQSLVASLLRRANSAASAPVAPVTTVRDAAVRLGVGSLLSIALAASVSSRMSAAVPAYGLEEGALWRESVAASVAADVIRLRARAAVPAEAGTAALLHDLGKVVLSSYLGSTVLEVPDRSAATDRNRLLEAESSLFGVDHTEVGAKVATYWRLPQGIVDAIGQHHAHDPELPPLSAAVSLAHAMLPHVLSPAEDRILTLPLSHRALTRGLGIDPANYPELLSTVRARYAVLAERYGVS